MQLTSTPVKKLQGKFTVPGDKSISHRSLILGAMATGASRVSGLLTGEDVLHTAEALKQMGVDIVISLTDKTAAIKGVGLHGLKTPKKTLDMGNSGTSARLLMGLLAGQNIRARFTGDASLSKRPMKRIAEPLEKMGAHMASEKGPAMTLPITVYDERPSLKTITYSLPMPSAQVKSAILLAGLPLSGETHIIEPIPCRDHTENMLAAMGADIRIDGTDIYLTGGKKLNAQEFTVPGDPSSAAFPTVAALITSNSEITMENIGMNPRRNGLFVTLQEMGADIQIENMRIIGGEPVADLTVRSSALKGITVPPERAPAMIDEYPVLFVAAAFATGDTIMRGLHELTVKESNRLQVMADGLRAAGVSLTLEGDDLTIHGNGRPPMGDVEIDAHLDHRIAMSFLTLGCASQKPVTITDASPIKTSFPGYVEKMRQLGAVIN